MDGLSLWAMGWALRRISGKWGIFFVQRHQFQIPANAPTDTLWAQTGLYTLDKPQRLP